MEVNKIIDAYVKFYKDKPTDQKSCPLTYDLIQKYQQEIDPKGYGYINLSACLYKEGRATLDKKATAYYKFLKSDDVCKLAEKIGISEDEILNVSMDAENGEPNQKWHLLVSYLGMVWFLGQKTIKLSSVSCPELWMWMFEVSQLFEQKHLKEIYDYAVLYRTGKATRQNWLRYINDKREYLDKHIMGLM